MIALDTETTGLDLWHGCKPFMVTLCDHAGDQACWEWSVNPETREPLIPSADRREIRSVLHRWRLRVFHNAKFDIRALEKVQIQLDQWENIHDTLIASHVLASGESHRLKDLALQYLDISDEDQEALKVATNRAREIGRKKGWRIAGPQDPHFPTQKRAPRDGWWVYDTWLPRAVAEAEDYPEDHPWRSVCRRYGLLDAERTLGLWLLFREALKSEGLWEVYQTRRQLLPVTYRMETRGVSANLARVNSLVESYREEEERSRSLCLRYASHKLDNLNSPKQLQGILFGHFRLKPSRATKTGYSTDAQTLETLQGSLRSQSRAFQFIRQLQRYRKFGKSLDYLEEYRSAGLPVLALLFQKPRKRDRFKDWVILHPSINVTGTKTTRFSSNNPNSQNIGKQEEYNLRRVFGPLPGREWYALDYENIELRIFAYCSGDESLIEAFNRGESVHLTFAEILHPRLFAQCVKEGASFKDRYKSTLYQWTKNGNFSLIYGAGPETADSTYRVPGAYWKIRKRLPRIDRFMKSRYAEGQRNGYITTLGGYRLQVPEDKPHSAVNYFVQGSAGWAMIRAMVRVADYLEDLPDYHLILTIHDELIFDFPQWDRNNSRIIRRIASLMEKSGNDFGFPLPVSIERITHDWSKGKTL